MISTYAETHTIGQPRIVASGFHPVVYCHSAGGSAGEIALTTVRRLCIPVCARGNKIVGHTTGTSWGTGGTSVGYAESGSVADSLALSDPGIPSLIGVSMGAMTSLVYALENPGAVASIGLSAPALDIEHYYANDINSLQMAIGTAWGVTWPTPLPAAAQIVTRAAELQGIPIRLYYSPIDIYTSPNYEAFAAASGAQLISVGDVSHADAPGVTPRHAFRDAVQVAA